jgi:hypothetical protein
MVVALVLGLRIAGDKGGVHRVLMIIIVRERGMDVRRREVGILLNDVSRTVAMRHVIGDEVDDPMAGAVEARDPAGVQGDVRIGRVRTHPCPPARVNRTRRSPLSGLPVAERTPSARQMAIERRRRDAQLARHVRDREGGIRQHRLGGRQLAGRQGRRAAARTAPSAGSVQPGPGALADDGAFKLGQTCEDVEHQPAPGRGGLDGLGEGAEPDLPCRQVLDRLDELRQRPRQAVELPDHQGIAGRA